ncbi:6-phosphofructokinase [Parenemella sanctibonifatiensis]|uniref:ATP-dependent 6-phosphofructokinase n=1 Tax=Parenemella sanctibonifatiensis TaxID=2016505 RepID=A0A255E815_9ACTN|nr:ATP-dependent 6-phosphofructokinase [Parenemella sanctibonifatiensis]OYN87684.1 6-phosphofructokinase [Parenemella sanctibonifatiensis]OYN89173.1 6-phosphofructokinase [Parenemella sanctibonifatiensis]
MRIGLITGGGDCPGLNAAIRAVVKHAENSYGHSVVGFRHGWKGLAEGAAQPMSRNDVRNVLPLGGTLLGTARYHPDWDGAGMAAVAASIEEEKISALICIGGDGSLSAAARVAAETGINVVGIPKTIDNDVVMTDSTIGFDTAVNIATEAVDRLHTTAESHNRVMVLEVMGRSAGWLAVMAGIAGGAEIVLAPEAPFDMDRVERFLKHRHRARKSFSIVVVAEGAHPAKGTLDYEVAYGKHGELIAGSVGSVVAREIEQRTGFETRLTVLGHVQRGGSPLPTDRILGSRFGVAAVDAIQQGRSNVMTAKRGMDIELVDLAEVEGKVKHVPEDLLRTANALA